MEYVTPEEMTALEARATARGLGTSELMENAGRAIAETVAGRYSGSRRAVILCGNGNNGGDGFVAARYLSNLGWRVRVILLSDPARIKTSEAMRNWERLAPPIDMEVVEDERALAAHGAWIGEADLVLDAIFGTGIKGEIREPARTAITLMNEARVPVVAVDVPSGLDPGTGEARGVAVEADLTIAVHAPKLGLRNNERYTGEIAVVSIGIEEKSRR